MFVCRDSAIYTLENGKHLRAKAHLSCFFFVVAVVVAGLWQHDGHECVNGLSAAAGAGFQ